MPRHERPDAAPIPPDDAEEPALLRPPGKGQRAVRRTEHNPGGYQETPINPSTAEADREAGENCALLHRARKEEDNGGAPADNSPGRPSDADQRGPRRTSK